jgi:hypothetical protein
MDRWIAFDANPNLDFYGIYKLINVEVAIIATIGVVVGNEKLSLNTIAAGYTKKKIRNHQRFQTTRKLVMITFESSQYIKI